MNFLSLLLPLIFVALFAYAAIKRVRIYDCFTKGVGQAIPLVLSVFPYLCAILMASELFERSGLSAFFANALSPVCSAVGIPPELSPLLLMKPFSGSGSTALLAEVLQKFGADSYLGRCACVCYGSSETVFYISAVYFAKVKGRAPVAPVLISLGVNFASAVFGCLLCRIL